MDNLKLDRSVQRITILKKDPESGKVRPAAVYRAKGRKKKTPKALRPIEKFLRRLGKAQARAASVYNMRHDRSAKKKKNGALRDLITNVSKARKQAWKSLRD
ncbi:MAG TPA: hypothetical protein VGJ82_08100 [Thermoanaerobaculia bacterium]|jgi:hypothetical protein